MNLKYAKGLPITYDDGKEKFDALLVDVTTMYNPFTFEPKKFFVARKLDENGELTEEYLPVNDKFKYLNFKHE